MDAAIDPQRASRFTNVAAFLAIGGSISTGLTWLLAVVPVALFGSALGVASQRVPEWVLVLGGGSSFSFATIAPFVIVAAAGASIAGLMVQLLAGERPWRHRVTRGLYAACGALLLLVWLDLLAFVLAFALVASTSP